MAVRPGQRAHCPRCLQAGKARSGRYRKERGQVDRKGGGNIRLLAVRPGQQAQGHRCWHWQQERAGRAGTAIDRDRLSGVGGGSRGGIARIFGAVFRKFFLTVESVDR